MSATILSARVEGKQVAVVLQTTTRNLRYLFPAVPDPARGAPDLGYPERCAQDARLLADLAEEADRER